MKPRRVSDPVNDNKWGPRDKNGVRSVVKIPRVLGVPRMCHCGTAPVELLSNSADYIFRSYCTCWLAAPGNKEEFEPCGFIKWCDDVVLEGILLLNERYDELESKVKVLESRDQLGAASVEV